VLNPGDLVVLLDDRPASIFTRSLVDLNDFKVQGFKLLDRNQPALVVCMNRDPQSSVLVLQGDKLGWSFANRFVCIDKQIAFSERHQPAEPRLRQSQPVDRNPTQLHSAGKQDQRGFHRSLRATNDDAKVPVMDLAAVPRAHRGRPQVEPNFIEPGRQLDADKVSRREINRANAGHRSPKLTHSTRKDS
jgi:hypothetical protein